MAVLQPGDPRRLGSYDLLERLGEGGQGVVYLGRDAAGNKAAIKLLRTDLAGDADARHRFVREAQAAKQVARFCTAQVLEADVAGDQPYIASEYVPGSSLYEQVSQQGPITDAGLDRLAIGTATALVAIHQAGIVHRDFKPHNVLMAPDGPRVIDFGIARALDTGQTNATSAIGTPSYMAPEQVAGQRLTEAVDVWAWATTIVYAATGRPPFGDDTVMAVINRVVNEPPSLQGVPDDLRSVLAACLGKDPARRPTAQQIMMQLIGANPAAQTQLDDPAQATSLLAEGSQLAGGTQPVGQTRRVDPAEFTGALPPARGYPPAGGPPRRPPRRDDYEPEGRRAWPIVLGVAAIVLLAVFVGVALARSGGDDPGVDPSPSVIDSPATTKEREPDPEPTRPRDTPTPTRTIPDPPTTPDDPPTTPDDPPTTPDDPPTTPEDPPTTPTGPPAGADPERP